jgi:hypothetical protein
MSESVSHDFCGFLNSKSHQYALGPIFYNLFQNFFSEIEIGQNNCPKTKS